MHSRDEIKEQIRLVLSDSFHRRSRPEERVYMTAYQILSFLPADARTYLISEAGPSGKGAGSYSSAASTVAKMIQEMNQADPGEIDVAMIDVRRLTLTLEGQTDPIEPGSNYGCGLYRLSRPGRASPIAP